MMVDKYYRASSRMVVMFSYNSGPDSAAAVPLGCEGIASLDKFINGITMFLHVRVV